MGVLNALGGRGSMGSLPPVISILLKFVGLALINAIGLLIFYTLWSVEQQGIALVFLAVTLLADLVIFVPSLNPIRWLTPGLIMMILMVIYPIVFTFTTAFTNFGTGHLFSKERSIELHGNISFVPEGAPVYQFTPYVSKDDPEQIALWLTFEADDGSLQVLWAMPNATLRVLEDTAAEPPEDFEGFRPMERRELVNYLSVLEDGTFGEAPDVISVTSASRGTASASVARYVYDAEKDAMYDQLEDLYYLADNDVGSWILEGGEDELLPGYQVVVGFDNFVRFLTNPSLSGPLFTVFVWTIVFAGMSVFTTFVLGLFMGMIMNEESIPYRKVIRSLLIIPYAIPAIISILTWRQMINPNIGVLVNSFGLDAPWFSSAFWARFGIIMINLWLGYPYMMLITSGALQSIPKDIYEAAEVDGAGSRQRFFNITLPLLLVAVGPLLIASFTFNFNNFVVIDAYAEGGPPIPGTLTPAGYTDILISYTYRLAFGSGRGQDFGLATAITIVIFLIVAGITLVNFRFTGQWEEVSENV